MILFSLAFPGKRSCDALITLCKGLVLLDGCPPEYAGIFRGHFAEQNFELISLTGIGNYGTFKKQIEILSEHNDSKLVPDVGSRSWIKLNDSAA